MDAFHQHTFVVLAYGESPFLEDCLKSLFNQTVRSQILISTSTPSVFLSQLANRYNLDIRVNTASGIAADWNFAYALAQTPFVTLAHQDDLYEPTYTETFLKLSGLYPDLVIGFTDYYELQEGKRADWSLLLLIKRLLLAPFWVHPVTSRFALKWLILSTGNPICCPSVWYNKARIGTFQFSSAWRVNLDWEAWRRLARSSGRFAFVRSQLTCHRKHPDSESTVTITSQIRRQEDTKLLSQVWGNRLGRLISSVYALGYTSYRDLV